MELTVSLKYTRTVISRASPPGKSLYLWSRHVRLLQRALFRENTVQVSVYFRILVLSILCSILGGACFGFSEFQYSVGDASISTDVKVIDVKCLYSSNA